MKFSLVVVLLLAVTLGGTVWLLPDHPGAPAAILAVLILWTFHRLAGRRLERIAKVLEGSAATGGGSGRIGDGSRDEIGRVCAAFDKLAGELEAERRKAEDSASSLEGQVQERTRRLEEAVRKLEEASVQKGRFLASMSHEIRAPIGAILGYAELLEDARTAPEDHRQALVSIRRNCQHLIDLVSDVLDLSKIEAGSLEVERTECSVNQVVKDVISVMSVRAHAKGLRLEEAYLTPVPERVVSDPTRIRQVLINLVGNAVKFTERGMVTISVGFTPCEAKRGRLEFRVQDTGIGIPKEKLELLFRPFQQLGPSTARRYGGTGLGLAISKQIARLLDGDLTVRSEHGLGSVFTFTARCEVAAGTPVHARPSAAVLADSGRKTLRQGARQAMPRLSGRVLVVDDGTDNRKLFRHHVESSGAEVEVAENGREAVERARAASFDLVLMDVQMPVLDGFEALREIRSLGIKTPVVALTAHAMKGDRERCLQAGFDDYVSKPVTKAALLEKLAAYLPGSRAQEAEP
ncbi:MAG: response regulator [Planctomycetes bacterium]|nr:response regulator [Planctomycetota bacterium]